MSMSVDKSRRSIVVRGSILRLATDRKSSARGGSVDALRPLLTKKAQRLACCQFLILIMFMVGFLYLVWLHEDIEHVYDLEHIMQIEMAKEFGEHSHVFDDVNDVHEVWEFIDDSFMKTMIKHKDQVGHFLPHDEWGFLAYYNRVIGGIRFMQERSKEHRCEFKRLDEFYGRCQPYHTHDHHSYGYPACNSSSAHNVSDVHNITVCYEQEYYEGSVDFYHDEGFTMDYDTKKFEMWIDLLDEEEIILKRVQYLKDRHWIDRQTKYLTIEFITYNGQTEPLISKTELILDFTRVGYVVPHTSIETVPLDPYFASAGVKVLFETLYLFVILNMIINEAAEINEHRKAMPEKDRSILKALKQNYFGDIDWFGNLLDLMVIICSVWLCVEWVLFVSNMSDVEDDLQSLHRPSGVVAYDDNDADVWSDYHHHVAHIEHEIQYAIDNMTNVRTLSVFVVFGIIFQMFKVWEGIPSLQGVSDTIVIAGKGLASFSVVVVCLITIFAGSAMLAFGQQLEEFHDVQSAYKTTLIVMTKSEPDVYLKQYVIDPVFASIWHWLLVIIMYMVCLNLILCILVDAYGEAHNAHSEGDRLTMPTLWQQSYDTFKFYSQDMWVGFKRRSSALMRGDLSSAVSTARSDSSSKVSPSPKLAPPSTDVVKSAHNEVNRRPTNNKPKPMAVQNYGISPPSSTTSSKIGISDFDSPVSSSRSGNTPSSTTSPFSSARTNAVAF